MVLLCELCALSERQRSAVLGERARERAVSRKAAKNAKIQTAIQWSSFALSASSAVEAVVVLFEAEARNANPIS